MNKASPVELRVSIEMAHNRLHDTAIKCAGTQQLRERIAAFWAKLLHQIVINKPRKAAWKGVILRRH